MGKNESKTSYRNFPLAKKSYFVRKVTPYLQSNIGLSRCLNNCLGPKNDFQIALSAA